MRQSAVTSTFIRPDTDFPQFNIVALLVGGSVVYRHEADGDLNIAKDWDGIIVVRAKIHIATLVNENRHHLCRLLSIVDEECPVLKVPTRTDLLWNNFDGVRFVGRTVSGTKKGVKILSLDYFELSKTTLNILSFKDRRTYEFIHTNCGGCRIQQATRLQNDLVILHDQWVFSGPSTKKCEHGNQLTLAMLGVTMDLLVTGRWIYEEENVGNRIKKLLLRELSTVSGRSPTIYSFVRSSQFRPAYRQWLADELRKLGVPPPSCRCSFPTSDFLYGAYTYVPTLPSSKYLQEHNLLEGNYMSSAVNSHVFIVSLPSVFSSNSASGTLTVDDITGRPFKTFWKRSSSQEAEIQGARQAANYYSRVQYPIVTASKALIYEWFNGQSQAEFRLSYINTGMIDNSIKDLVIIAELRKSEDILRAYCMSLQPSKLDASHLIHRFFYERVRNNLRMLEFYGDGIVIDNKLIPLPVFANSPIVINNTTYPSLNELLTQAEIILNPCMLSSPIVFGLGDAHGGNFLIGNNITADNSRDFLHIDYEVAGFHSPLLDLAKPLYNDIFFNILYADVIRDAIPVNFTFSGERVVINLNVQMDPLSRAIREIKRRYFVEPFFEFAECNSLHLRDLNYIRQLGFALFTCAVLSRNFVGRWDAFFANLAIGTVLSQIQRIEQLWELGT